MVNGKHRWTPAVLSFCIFLYFMALGSTVGPFPELILQRQCDKAKGLHKCKSTDAPCTQNNAVAKASCTKNLGPKEKEKQHQHDLYDTAQKDAAGEVTLFYLFPGIAGFATVPGVGHLGDIYGRKKILIFISVGGILYIGSMLFIEKYSTFLIFVTIASLPGGIFASVACVFASLADITQVLSEPPCVDSVCAPYPFLLRTSISQTGPQYLAWWRARYGSVYSWARSSVEYLRTDLDRR
jgi:MFS family permease